jgi:hypothetical protein
MAEVMDHMHGLLEREDKVDQLLDDLVGAGL